MNTTPYADATLQTDETTYESPELLSIGAASAVILGMPGGGFDGAYGITYREFEFESDELD